MFYSKNGANWWLEDLCLLKTKHQCLFMCILRQATCDTLSKRIKFHFQNGLALIDLGADWSSSLTLFSLKSGFIYKIANFHIQFVQGRNLGKTDTPIVFYSKDCANWWLEDLCLLKTKHQRLFMYILRQATCDTLSKRIKIHLQNGFALIGLGADWSSSFNPRVPKPCFH